MKEQAGSLRWGLAISPVAEVYKGIRVDTWI